MEQHLPESSIVRNDAAALAAGYTPGFRVAEILSIFGFFAFSLGLAARLAPAAAERPGLMGFAVLSGWIAADFVSGLVHWGGDTWGTTAFPVLGQTLIRTFREHHVDQKSITRHDFVETNGTNCMATLPILGAALFVDVDPARPGLVLAVAFLLSLCLWVFLTNQIHKWAHMDTPPRFVGVLQRAHLVLGPEHHALHHAPPHLYGYCITTGWLNPVLARIKFYRRAEVLITAITGAIPRQDDIGLHAALEVAPGE